MPLFEKGGSYLKNKDLKSGETITFRDEGEWRESKFPKEDGTPKREFVIGVTYKGAEKKMRLNGMSQDAMIAAYGKHSKDWVGHPAMIEKVVGLVAGEKKDIVTLEVPGAARPMTDKEKSDVEADLAAVQEKEIPF